MEDVKLFDATEELKTQYVRMNKDQSNIDWLRVKSGDIIYIFSHLDVFEWWKTIGIMRHPDVLVAALPVLATPASNAFQERIISALTWYYDPINQGLKMFVSKERFC